MPLHRRFFYPRLTTAILLAFSAWSLIGLGSCFGPNPAEPDPPADRKAARSPAGAGVDTLAVLADNRVPAGDWRDEAIRLKGIPDIPEVVSTTPAGHAIGAVTDFYVLNADDREPRSLSAQLVYETENVYFFVEQGVAFDEPEVARLVDEFQGKIYPANRAFFGSEWIPGVDGDPRMYMLYARGLGRYVQAYFDSASEFSRLAHPYSNEKEIIVLNADAGPLSDAYWRPTLAHEFQHMIHWFQNRNAELWLNEGASMLAQVINGYDAGAQASFLNAPDLQLNTWADLSASPAEAVGHYDAAFLFLLYFFDRFGDEAIQTLVTSRSVGISAVDSTLALLGLTDPATGRVRTSEDVFADWVAANYLNDRSLAQGQYGYESYAYRIPGPTDTIAGCPTGLVSASVHQFGARYIELNCRGSVTIHFDGAEQVRLVPTHPHGGRHAMWSSRQDESDTTLTRAFDLGRVESATLVYWAWWEIEKDYDFAYVEVSADGGETWEILRTPSGTAENITGSNLGWGYTGCSGGGDPGSDCTAVWVQETVDLAAYAGQTILVRFETITDTALNYPGLMLDDISVPEIHYACGFEKGDCGWEGRGFARVDNVLPQSFVVQLIHRSGGRTTVTRLPLDADRRGSLALILERGDVAILVVSGTTPFTTEEASFVLEIR